MRTIEEFTELIDRKKLNFYGITVSAGWGDKRAEFDRKNSIYYVNEIPVDICFAGDSITESFEVNAYFSKFGTVINRGIGGETIEYLAIRFPLDVVALKPKICIVSEGINNTYELYKKYSAGQKIPEEDIDNEIQKMLPYYKTIAEQCVSAGIKLIFSSVLPIGVYDFRNSFILKLNAAIKELCAEFSAKGAKICYANTYSSVVSADKIIMDDLTFGDKLHPHVLGYNRIAKALEPYIEKFIGENVL